jgi:uncharacterized protein involved in outer membrane biogenesis
MTNEAFRDSEALRRTPSPGERRMGVGDRWRAARSRLHAPRFRKPSRKTTYRIAGVLAVLAVAIAVLFAIWDWNWFRGPLARIASARTHREVTITGNLNANIWSWQPSATVDGIHIANPAWAEHDRMADVDRVTVKIRLLPLLIGHLDLRLLRFDGPNVRLFRNAKGQANWDFSDGAKPDQPLKLPPIRNFIIHDGQLRYHDAKRQLTFAGHINAAEKLGGGQDHGFELTGDGLMNHEPFRLQVTGGPLLNIRRDQPYPFDADVRSGQTVITARGAVARPFDLGQVYANVTLRGPDMDDLFPLTGVALPETPPYSLHGRVARSGNLYKVDGLGGRVGQSDLAGHASVQMGGPRPVLKASLTSQSLHFPDLGALFGAAPLAKPGDAAKPDQQADARKLIAEQRLFPDATLKVDHIRALDADVTYKALSIRDAPVHLKAGSARIKLDAGLLRAEPLVLDLPQGHVAGYVQLDARKATPVTDLDLRLTDARLEQLIPIKADGPLPLTGSLVGRARLTGTGDSVHKAFASSNGRVMVVAPDGEIRKAFAELLGIDVFKGLGLLFAKNQDKTDLRCAVADFDTKNGVMTANHIVFDTGPVLGLGSGSINLDTERMDFRLQGHPKKFRIGHLAAPITVTGPIMAPKPGIQAGGAIAQGGVALALSSVLSPLAAILPFIDAGLAKDAPCGALIAQAEQRGAPVATVRH